MVSRKEDSTSFFAALLMSGTCNYSFLLSAVNSLHSNEENRDTENIYGMSNVF